MSNEIGRDLGDFHRFVGEKLASGGDDLSPEEAVDQWRLLHPAPAEIAESVAALRQALTDMHSGDRGRSVETVVAEARQRLQESQDE